MFDSLRDTFHSVQENLTTSLRNLTTSDPVSKGNVNKPSTQVNLYAGTEILERFQNAWSDLHSMSQENATKAQEVDQLIGKLHKQLEKQWTDIGQTATALSKIPQVVASIKSLSEKLVTLEQLFEDVETSLIDLEDTVETRELQEQQLDHRFQLALYKEKKLSVLENVRVTLAKEHAEKVKTHELRQQRIQRERQQAFEHQFKQDVQLYKESKSLPHIAQHSGKKDDKEHCLEEVVLDAEDDTALDDFLKDSNEEDTAKDVLTEPT